MIQGLPLRSSDAQGVDVIFTPPNPSDLQIHGSWVDAVKGVHAHEADGRPESSATR